MIALLLLFFAVSASHGATLTVSSTADDGSEGTLRWAITAANVDPDYDEVT